MQQPNRDLIQGTLDMILKALSMEPMHGFGIEQVSRSGSS